MTIFVKQGSSFHPTSEENLDIHHMLPVGTYIVLFDPKQGYYLEQSEDLKVPSKLYGSAATSAQRILRAFHDRAVNTGVLLSGEKGTGKTMLSRTMSCELAKQHIPTLLINERHMGDAFNKFITSITQPCLIIFDEFEKVYEREHQSTILTLLDGVFTSKKLFVFTCNDKYSLSSYMLNRPGRIFYHIRYRGLDAKAIEEYCADHLKDQTQIKSIFAIAATIDSFNFDMLQNLVEEMNRFGETAYQAVQLMNIRPESSSYTKYKITVIDVNKPERIGTANTTERNPLQRRVDVYVTFPAAPGEDNDACELSFEAHDLVHMTPTGDMIFEKDKYRATFTKRVATEFTYGT